MDFHCYYTYSDDMSQPHKRMYVYFIIKHTCTYSVQCSTYTYFILQHLVFVYSYICVYGTNTWSCTQKE